MNRSIFVIIIVLAVITSSKAWRAPRTSGVGTPPQSNTLKRSRASKLVPHRISLANGRSFDLNLPQGFAISVAAQGLKRVRFLANRPDNRVFVTDMYNLNDNKRGVVYILDDFDLAGKTFKKVVPYLSGLRNPNSIGFYTDQQRVNWFYLALTDRLLRYRYNVGDEKPSGEPEVLATFPDYGLSYRYGGWHLTRTIVVGGNGKIYVSVGSSCNACVEKEPVRASILEMDPDGKNQKHFARGLRNAVGLRWAKDQLFATNMGSDHLGDHKPADTLYVVRDGVNYGWPYCFQSGRGRFPDSRFNLGGRKMSCRSVPSAYAAFDAHSSPLGLEYFDASHEDELKNSFLVALHGSTKRSLNRGYRVVRVPGTARRSIVPEDFINGFLEGKVVHGRPVDVLGFGTDAFLLTDDHAGVVYCVYKQ